MMSGDHRDPIQKLDELRNWLRNNKVGGVAPESSRPTCGIKITGEQAKLAALIQSQELYEFENWVNEIQSPQTNSWFVK